MLINLSISFLVSKKHKKVNYCWSYSCGAETVYYLLYSTLSLISSIIMPAFETWSFNKIVWNESFFEKWRKRQKLKISNNRFRDIRIAYETHNFIETLKFVADKQNLKGTYIVRFGQTFWPKQQDWPENNRFGISTCQVLVISTTLWAAKVSRSKYIPHSKKLE